MCKKLTHLIPLVLAFGLIGTTEAAFNTVGVYDPDDEPHHNQVDQSGTYSSHTGDAGPENVIDLATFQALIGPAFRADAGGVVNIESTDGSLDGQDIIAKFGVSKAKSLKISSVSGIINTGSSVKQGRTPTSGRNRLAKTDTGNFEFDIGPLTGGKPGEVVTYFAGTLLDRDDANLAPVVTATFSGGGTVTAVATMSGKPPSSDQDTFFGFVAPLGQSIVNVNFDPTGNYTNMDDVAFITSAFVVVSKEATSPKPRKGQIDVPRDAVLSWAPGAFAQTHDVYFGTTFADVNTASRTDQKGVLVSQGQDAVTYDPPGLLAFGRTFYWRVDEVNAPPSDVIIKGSVWSFTVEPYAYPIQNVTATASSAQEGMGPERTVDSSGLNAAGQHSTEPNGMWLSAKDGPQPTWIQYEFDKLYKLQQLRVWNSNQMLESALGLGAQSVTVEYSADALAWTTLGDFEFARASGQATYASDITVDCAGAVARCVKLTIHNNWGGLAAQYGLSEVRFLYLPVLPREPLPGPGRMDVAVDTLLSWRAGREAASHQVYFAADQQVVSDGTAPAQTVAEDSFDPGPLELGATYYWKVTEVNEAEMPPLWQGDLWSFSTIGYLVVDDFESYDDEEGKGTRIYETWSDGWADNSSGSQVGYTEPPFAERTTVHAGGQSMPLAYDNSALASSQADRTFDEPQDWTAHGIRAISLSFYGPADNVPGQLYLRVNGKKVAYSGPADDLRKAQWVSGRVELAQFSTDLRKVRTLGIGVDGAGARGKLFIDDIQLAP